MKIKQLFLLSLIAIFSVVSFLYIKNIDRKKDNQVIVVGTSADYPPYAFIDTTNNEVVGFDIDVAREVVSRLYKKIIIKDIPFSSLIFDLFAQKINVIAAGMTPTARRSRGVLFSQKYLEADPLMVITKKFYSNINSLEGLAGKTVVVNTGYTADLYLSDKSDINIVRLKTPAESFMALKSGSVDAFVCAKSSLVAFLSKSSAQDYFIAKLPDTGDDYALVVSKHDHGMLEQINKALDGMKKDGTLQALKKKWNLE